MRGNMENGCSKKQLHGASSGIKQCEMSNKQGRTSKRASFIKVLGHDFSKQLQLPEDFTINMNGYVPHRFIIESFITKKCWRVEVEMDEDGRIYFRNGWADFVNAHSLQVGNFLTFEYEEQSIFQVRIYNRNGCERTLLSEGTKEGGYKCQKTINDEESEDVKVLESEPETIKCHESKTRRLAPRKCGKGICKRRKGDPKSYRRTMEVSISKNNVSFSITIHPCLKHQFQQQDIPKAVSLKMKLHNKAAVKLQDAQGHFWNVKLAHKSNGIARFSQGWKEFLKDNDVSPRDKIEFKVVSERVIQVLVTKFSKVDHEFDEGTGSYNDDSKHEKSSSTSGPKRKVVEMPKTSRKTCFRVSQYSFSCVWKKSSNRSNLYLPKAIVRAQNLMKKDNVVLCDSKEKCWPIKVKKLTRNGVAFGVAFSKGWIEFWRGHGLVDGDFLNFKFVSENLIQVSINKSTKKQPLKSSVEDDIMVLDEMDTTDDVGSSS